MNTYNLPRNVKGEGKILVIFSYKAFIYTAVGLIIGYIIRLLLKTLHINMIGNIIMIIMGIIGFSIATFKIPETNIFGFTKYVGGEKIDDVIIKWFKFKNKKCKMYTFVDTNDMEEK